MTKKEIGEYKDKRNLKKGFNAYWNKGFNEAIALLTIPKEQLTIPVVKESLILKSKELEHLEDYINDVANEQRQRENLEYSEREVLEMLESYKIKFSLSGVVKSLPNIDSIIVEPLNNYLERTGSFTKDQSNLIAKEFYNYVDDYDIYLGI